MKLRLRSLQSKETTKVEVPDSCTLNQLKHKLSQSLPNSPSSLHLSLNRTHELLSSSPNDDDSLLSLGITSGDLIYFSLGNSQQPIFDSSPTFENSESFVPNMAENKEPSSEKSGIFEESVVKESYVENDDVEEMDVDDIDKRVSEPYFLRRVLRKELDGDVNNRKLLVVAVHAVFVESGFVGFDSVSGLRVDGFHLADEWPSMAVSMKLVYTLPELLEDGSVKESMSLKFQSVGRFVNVYGSLAKAGSGLYRVCLDENRFAQALTVAWQNCGIDDRSSRLDIDKDVFEFWKIVKDGLALPLQIDLCDKTGLALPTCLMRLPAELKFKILESLPGVDVARMGCVCSEMKYLSSLDDLWKQKVAEEFKIRSSGQRSWKITYAIAWQFARKPKGGAGGRQRCYRVFRPPIPIGTDPDRLRFPSPIIGGYDDMTPGGSGIGFPAPYGKPSGTYRRFRLNFSPHCNLGGFNT